LNQKRQESIVSLASPKRSCIKCSNKPKTVGGAHSLKSCASYASSKSSVSLFNNLEIWTPKNFKFGTDCDQEKTRPPHHPSLEHFETEVNVINETKPQVSKRSNALNGVFVIDASNHVVENDHSTVTASVGLSNIDCRHSDTKGTNKAIKKLQKGYPEKAEKLPERGNDVNDIDKHEKRNTILKVVQSDAYLNDHAKPRRDRYKKPSLSAPRDSSKAPMLAGRNDVLPKRRSDNCRLRRIDYAADAEATKWETSVKIRTWKREILIPGNNRMAQERIGYVGRLDVGRGDDEDDESDGAVRRLSSWSTSILGADCDRSLAMIDYQPRRIPSSTTLLSSSGSSSGGAGKRNAVLHVVSVDNCLQPRRRRSNRNSLQTLPYGSSLVLQRSKQRQHASIPLRRRHRSLQNFHNSTQQLPYSSKQILPENRSNSKLKAQPAFYNSNSSCYEDDYGVSKDEQGTDRKESRETLKRRRRESDERERVEREKREQLRKQKNEAYRESMEEKGRNMRNLISEEPENGIEDVQAYPASRRSPPRKEVRNTENIQAYPASRRSPPRTEVRNTDNIQARSTQPRTDVGNTANEDETSEEGILEHMSKHSTLYTRLFMVLAVVCFWNWQAGGFGAKSEFIQNFKAASMHTAAAAAIPLIGLKRRKDTGGGDVPECQECE